MSETVHYKGKLVRLNKNGEDYRDIVKQLIVSKHDRNYFYETLETYKSFYTIDEEIYQNLLDDDFYKEYYINNENLYKVEKRYVDMDIDIFNSEIVNDNEIKFEVKYYNGGCGLNEALDLAIKNSKESL